MSDLRADAPAEVRFLFQDTQKRSAGALAISLGIHGAMFGLAIWVAMHPAVAPMTTRVLDNFNDQIVWLDVPGPGGGGGGGGNESPEPVKQVQLKGKEKITVPVEKPPAMEEPQEKPPPENPIQNLTIPAQTLASADLAQAGAMEGVPTSESLGLGRGGGAGTGQGTGIGSGRGSGLGEGWGGGTGGGAYRPGNGVETPRLLQEVKPQYTAQAMRAKIQGEVLLECIVQPDGSVGNIKVVRSLDSAFGLDQEAIKAARQWRFQPGTRQGQPVPVLVTIAIAFTLR
jgi:periplasmic protein TonB